MTKLRLGMLLHENKKTPLFVKKLLRLRWEYNSNRLERKYRAENSGNIFSIPFSDSENVLFELPVARDLISRDIIVQKRFYEHEYLIEVKKLINNPTCIIDVGANIGNHTLFFKKSWPGTTVYSFEPQLEIFHQLKKNLELNGVTVLGCFNKAVGNKIGRGKIIYNGQVENNTGATRIDYDDSGSFDVISLDDFIENHPQDRIDLIKIDVEGFELKVLEGMKKIIKKHNPYIWIEVLDNNKEAAFSLFKDLQLEFIDLPLFNEAHDFLIR